MTDLIKVKNASYILYEELLLKKENLQKEGKQYYISYLKLFGDLLTEAFKKKVECIRKKKMIAFCQRCVNQGKLINAAELYSGIEAEMSEYEEELNRMAAEIDAASKAKYLTPDAMRQIKAVYYRLARRIHPDMRPDLSGDMILADYWNQITLSYQHNDLNRLEELEVLVNTYLEGREAGRDDIVIEDIEDRISRIEAEIDAIVSHHPYTYRFILEDTAEISAKQEELENEINEYTEYSAELDEVLKTFDIKEMYA